MKLLNTAKKITTAAALVAALLALAVLHPGRFWTFAGGVRFST